jgi:hypothetical protein
MKYVITNFRSKNFEIDKNIYFFTTYKIIAIILT